MQIVRQKPPRSNGNSSTPQDASLPAPSVEKAVGPLSVFDELLKVAPHNVMAQLFRGGQAPPTIPQPLPPNLQTLPATASLKPYASNISNGAALIEKDMTVFLPNEGSTVIIRNTDREYITLYYTEDEVVESEETFDWWGYSRSSKTNVPGVPRGAIAPEKTKFITLKRNETQSFKEGKGAYKKTVSSGILGFNKSDTYLRQRTFITLVPPIAPSDSEITGRNKEIADAQAKIPKPEDIEGLRTKYLGEVDGWIRDAQSKLNTMNYTDIASMNQDIADIQGAQSGLSQANSTGQVPAFPLFAGGGLNLLPLFSGGILPPLPFFMMSGGQVGSASSQVSTLSSLLSQANSLKTKVTADAQAANTAYTNLQGYRQGLVDAKDKNAIEYNHTQAGKEHDTVVQKTADVHDNVTDTWGGMAYYKSASVSAYNQGISAISGQAATTQAEAQQAAQDAAAAAATAAAQAQAATDAERARQKQLANSLAQQGRSLVAQGRFSEAATKFNQAAQAYDKAGDSSNASMARQLSSDATSKQSATEAAESAREIAQQKEWDLSSQANRLAQSGDNEGAAKIYDQLYLTTGNSVYKTFADNQRKFGAQSKAKAESKAKGEEAIKAAYEYRRKLAEAKRRKSSA
jgi:hypothetical protein